MIIIIFFVAGLIIGSFLNVVVYRLNIEETITGRSYCPHCKAQIRWYDNIPLLSFALLRAECRDCQGKISWFYPTVEFFTGIIFAFVGYFFAQSLVAVSWMEVAFYLAVFSILIVIAVYDLQFMEIPLLAVWAGVAICLGYFLWQDFESREMIARTGIFSAKTALSLLGGLFAGAIFFSLSYFSKEKWMGMGDGYIGLLVGMIVGWPMIAPTLTASFFLGAIAGIVLVALKIKGLKSQVPFAPFLVVGTMAVIFLFKIFPQLGYYF